MSGLHGGSVLRRIARPSPPEEPPVTPARILRLALARAAERSAGLGLTVTGVAIETPPLDRLVGLIDPAHLLLSLGRDEGLAGFLALDLELRTALIEVQTIGRLRPKAAEPRPITATDAALAQPLAQAFLLELVHGLQGSPLQGWAEGCRVENRLTGPRAAENALGEGDFRLVRLGVDLGVGERQGQLLLAIRLPAARAPAAEGAAVRFAEALRRNVLGAEAELHAILHRLRMPLAQAERLAPGQILALPGVSVADIRIEGPDGRSIGRGRLGQSAGLRAVRVEGTSDTLVDLRPAPDPGRTLPAPDSADPDADYGARPMGVG